MDEDLPKTLDILCQKPSETMTTKCPTFLTADSEPHVKPEREMVENEKAESEGTSLTRRQKKNKLKGQVAQQQPLLNRNHHRSSDSSSSEEASPVIAHNQTRARDMRCIPPVVVIAIRAIGHPCFDACLLKKHGYPDHVNMRSVLLPHILKQHLLAENGYPVIYNPYVMYEGGKMQWGCLGVNTSLPMHPGYVYFRGWMPKTQLWKSGHDLPKKGGSVESSDQDSSSDSEIANESCSQTFPAFNGQLAQPYVNDTVNCARCRKNFVKHRSNNECRFHPQWIHTGYGKVCRNCHRHSETVGCELSSSHVWSGSVPGLNGPFSDYMRTMPPNRVLYTENVYAIDCEMCYTREGLELCRVTLVDLHGHVIYNQVVQPSSPIIDYNTAYSGMTPKDFDTCTKSLAHVQADLFRIMNSDTILIGHALENDLRALKIVHQTVIDTSLFAMNSRYHQTSRASLKVLAKTWLGKTIQDGSHDSFEDALIAMELVLTFVKNT